MTADIKAVWVTRTQRDLQRIFWREDDSKPIRIYRLKTVTYGTATAPYLATKTLNYLADVEAPNMPIIFL